MPSWANQIAATLPQFANTAAAAKYVERSLLLAQNNPNALQLQAPDPRDPKLNHSLSHENYRPPACPPSSKSKYGTGLLAPSGRAWRPAGTVPGPSGRKGRRGRRCSCCWRRRPTTRWPCLVCPRQRVGPGVVPPRAATRSCSGCWWCRSPCSNASGDTTSCGCASLARRRVGMIRAKPYIYAGRPAVSFF
jgi:hypothetical protein